MATDKYEKLAAKLRELFQLDQPDLDFGIYRVMHLKRDAVEHYLDPKAPDGLRAAIEADFASASAQSANENLEKARAKVVEAFGADAIGADGSLASGYAATPFGKAYAEAQAVAASAQSSAEGEKDVFDLLLDFFSRYYQGGDFVSKRHISRESDSRALSYAIPYGGEEVKLHWANADQYYIKTSENFSSYTFDLSQSREIKSMDAMARMANRIPNRPMRVHFKIVEAEEGEHGNVKAGEDRFFFVDEEHPFEIPDDPEGELTVFFHHAADPNKPDKAKNWQKQLLAKSRDIILGNLDSFTSGLDSDYAAHPVHAYYAMLMTACPTDGDPDRVLLDRYLEQYAARNTEDYFIHKDLGGFLRRELEFYVKNEILNISDLARQPDEALMAVSEAQLRRARAFYRVARRIVDDFLAPLEDFQKKLWLKRKFVVQCDWCITMDQVPEELRGPVLANKAQQEEWKRLGVDADPKADSLTATDARMVDTKFFDETFKAKLLAAIPDLDERTDGVLVHSENFQALRLMQERYKEQVKCIYIDPPYNTGSDNAFLYKDNYQHSSWLSCLQGSIGTSRALMQNLSGILASTDDGEYANLRILMGRIFGDSNFVADIIWNSRKSVSNDALISGAINHTTFFTKDKDKLDSFKAKFRLPEEGEGFSNPDNDPRGPWKLDPMDAPAVRENLSYAIVNPTTEQMFYPPNGRHWRFEESTTRNYMAEGRILFGRTGNGRPAFKRFLSDAESKGKTATTLWDDVKTTTEATNMLLELFGDSIPKTIVPATDNRTTARKHTGPPSCGIGV